MEEAAEKLREAGGEADHHAECERLHSTLLLLKAAGEELAEELEKVTPSSPCGSLCHQRDSRNGGGWEDPGTSEQVSSPVRWM